MRGAWGNVKDFAVGLVHGADHGKGAVLGAAFGAVNQPPRGQVGPGLPGFLGDVFVYQRHRQDLQQRLWAEVEAHAPGYGTQERPIAVLGHSLGGVISFDTAVAGTPQPLWVKALVTFGSPTLPAGRSGEGLYLHLQDLRR